MAIIMKTKVFSTYDPGGSALCKYSQFEPTNLQNL